MAITEYLPEPIVQNKDLPGAASVAPSPAAPAQPEPQQQPQPEQPPVQEAPAMPAPPPSIDEILQAQGFKPLSEMSIEEFARVNIAFASRQFQNDVKTGVGASLARGAFNTAGSVANLFGKAEWKYAADKLAAKFPPEVPTYKDIKSWGDLGTFAVEAGMENLANALIVAGTSYAALATGAPVLAGTVAGSSLLAAGETAQTVDDSGAERTVANIVPATVMNTALETFAFAKVFKNAGLSRYFGEAVESAAQITGFGKNLKDALGKTGSSFVTEAVTETAQTYINQVNAELANNEKLRDAIKLLPKEQEELINAALKGGFGASMTTGTSQAVIKGQESVVKSLNNKANKAPLQDGEAAPEAETPPNPATEIQSVLPAATPIEDTPLSTQVQGEELSSKPTAPDLAPTEELSKLSAAITKNLGVIGVEEKLASGSDAFRAATGRAPLSVRRLNNSSYEVESDGSIIASNIPETWIIKPVSFIENGVLQSKPITIGQVQSNKPRTYITGEGTTLFNGTIKNAKMVAEISEVVEQWRSKYLPDRSIILGDHDPIAPDEVSSSTAGYHSSLIDFNQYQEAATQGNIQSPISHIVIRPEVVKNVLFENAKVKGEKVSNSSAMSAAMAVLSHEVGHAVIAENISRATPNELSALKGEHREFLTRLPTMTFREVISELGSPAELQSIMVDNSALDSNFKDIAEKYFDVKTLNYLLSFDEYAAEKFASFATANKPTESVSSFWDKTVAQLRALFKDFSGLFVTAPKFEAWVRNIGYKNRIRELLLQVPFVDSKISPHLKSFSKLAGDFKQAKIKIDQNNATDSITSYAGESLTASVIEAMKRTEHLHTGFTKLGFYGLTPLQIAERYKIPEAARYMETVQKWSATKMRGLVHADEVSKQWLNLSTAQSDAFSRVLYDASEISQEQNRKLSPAEIMKLLQDEGLDETHYALYQDVRKTFDDVLSRLRIATEIETLQEFTNNPREMLSELDRVGKEGRAKILSLYAPDQETDAWAALDKTRKQFVALENHDYFPRMRFGEYTVSVYNLSGARRTLEIFEVYESESDAISAQEQYNATYKNDKNYERVTVGRLTDTAKSMYGMPQVVVRSIGDKLRAAEGALTSEQEKALAMAESDLSPGKAFLRQLRKRKNTPGFSRDAQRTFSAYMGSASNHLARIEHSKEMVDNLAALSRLRKQYSGNITDLELMHSYYQEHFKYIFNPENEYASLRSAAFHWYLGFNIKSAFVNTTQPLLVTLPYLTARYGSKETAAAMSKAYVTVTKHMVKKVPLSETNQRVLDRLTDDGILDESASSDLAAMAEQGWMFSNNRAKRATSKLSEYSSYMFRVAEKYNRRTTAIATFNLHMEQTKNFEESYKAAVNAIQRTQFEYAKWNRPIFQRGPIKSSILVFTTYTQQFLFLAASGARTPESFKTAKRMMGLALITGGLMGLPGSDYLMGIINAGGTALASALGLDEPELNIEKELRETFKAAGLSPDLILNGGASNYGLGPLHIAEIFGAPVPNMNIQGSLSMASPLPGIREIQGDASLADYVFQAGGALSGIAKNIYDGLTSHDPDTWKNSEKFMPVAMKNVSKAARHAARGEERTRGGQFILYDSNSPEAWAEIMFEGLGFTSTRSSQMWALYGEQASGAAYLSARRQALLEHANYARFNGDVDAYKEARQDILEWNHTHTSKETRPYRISAETIARSYKSKLRTLKLREKGLPVTERDRLFYQETAQSREE